MSEEQISQSKIIMEMHGDIKTLLANYENFRVHMDKMSDHIHKTDIKISGHESDLTKIKTIGATITLLWGLLAGYFTWKK